MRKDLANYQENPMRRPTTVLNLSKPQNPWKMLVRCQDQDILRTRGGTAAVPGESGWMGWSSCILGLHCHCSVSRPVNILLSFPPKSSYC